MELPARVSGVVRDASTGRALHARIEAGTAAHATALAEGAIAIHSWHPGLVGGIYSGRDGAFDFQLGPYAEYLVAKSSGYEPIRLPIQLTPGERRDGLVIELTPKASEPPN